jgi:hypothetical protein
MGPRNVIRISASADPTHSDITQFCKATIDIASPIAKDYGKKGKEQAAMNAPKVRAIILPIIQRVRWPPVLE